MYRETKYSSQDTRAQFILDKFTLIFAEPPSHL